MKHKYLITIDVLIGKGEYRGKPCPKYRTSKEEFSDYNKALKKFERLIKLHSPEWRISLGNISSGLFNCIIANNNDAHHVWLADEKGIEIHGINLAAIRASL